MWPGWPRILINIHVDNTGLGHFYLVSLSTHMRINDFFSCNVQSSRSACRPLLSSCFRHYSTLALSGLLLLSWWKQIEVRAVQLDIIVSSNQIIILIRRLRKWVRVSPVKQKSFTLLLCLYDLLDWIWRPQGSVLRLILFLFSALTCGHITLWLSIFCAARDNTEL